MRGFFHFSNIVNAAILIGIGGFLSRLLGLLRDRILASTFGAGRELDIYYAAFRIPDFIYGILILGAISAVFIPLFTSLPTEQQKNQFASSALNIVVLLIGSLSFLLFLLAPFVIRIIAPGFEKEDKVLTVLLTRIMLLQPIILALSHVITSILQSFNRFLATALAPSFYNLGIILGIIFFVPVAGLKGLAYGLLLGAFLHLLIQLPQLFRTSFRWQPTLFVTHEIKKMFTLMGPRILGIASEQINFIIITALASTLSLGSIAIFNLAQNIQGAPVGIIGIAIATAIFPTLSLAYTGRTKDEFAKTFLEAFHLTLFFGIPFSILFILLRAQIVRVVLGAGLFGWEDTRLSAAALGIFGLSVFAQSLIPLLTRAFYSMQNTKTPVIVGMGGVVVNLVLAFVFIHFLSFQNAFVEFVVKGLKLTGIPDIRVLALPLAFSLTIIGEFLLLFFLLFLRIDGVYLGQVNKSWRNILFATLIMAGITYGALRPLALLVDMTTGLGVFLQALGAGIIGIAIYFIITKLLNENPLFPGQSTDISSKFKVQS